MEFLFTYTQISSCSPPAPIVGETSRLLGGGHSSGFLWLCMSGRGAELVSQQCHLSGPASWDLLTQISSLLPCPITSSLPALLLVPAMLQVRPEVLREGHRVSWAHTGDVRCGQVAATVVPAWERGAGLARSTLP